MGKGIATEPENAFLKKAQKNPVLVGIFAHFIFVGLCALYMYLIEPQYFRETVINMRWFYYTLGYSLLMYIYHYCYFKYFIKK